MIVVQQLPPTIDGECHEMSIQGIVNDPTLRLHGMILYPSAWNGNLLRLMPPR